MPIKAGQIVIDVNAGTAKMLVDLEAAKGKLREFGASGKSSMAPTSAALKELEGNFTSNNRAVARFMADTLKLGPVLQAAFPLIGGLAFAGMLSELGVKVVNFFKEIQQGPEKARGAFHELNASVVLTNAGLEVSNARLENQIAKLEGKHENTLKLALLEAKEAAEKLAESLDKDLASMNKLLKDEGIGFWRKFFGEQGVDDIQKYFGGATGYGGFRGAMSGATNSSDQTILLQAALERIAAWTQEAESAARPKVVAMQPVSGRGPAQLTTVPGQDETVRLEILRALRSNLQSELDRVSLQTRNSALTQKKDALEPEAAQNKKDQEELNRLNEELVRIKAAHLDAVDKIAVEEKGEIARLTEAKSLNASTLAVVHMISEAKLTDAYNENLKQYNDAILKSAEHWARVREEQRKTGEEAYKVLVEPALKGLERMAVAINKLNEEYLKMLANSNRQGVQYQVAMIGISGQRSDPIATLQKQQDVERADIQKRYNDALAEANKTLTGAELILKRRNLLAERQLELDRLDYEMQEKKAAETRSIGGHLSAGARDAKSPQEIANDAIDSAEDRVADQLSRLMTGQKPDVARMLKDMGQSILKETIKAELQKALGHLGPHKPTGNAGDPVHVVVDNQAAGPGQPGPATPNFQNLPGIIKNLAGGFAGLGSLFSAGGGGAAAGGLTEAVTSSISFMAAGGSVDPGGAYIVGDGGEPELFSPRTSGTITPLSKMGGVHNYTIDARGADLGAGNRVARAIEAAHNSAVATGVRANAERGRRTPQRA